MKNKDRRKNDWNLLLGLVSDLTIPCENDDLQFTRRDRIDLIERFLKQSNYQILKQEGLAMLYARKPLDQIPRFILISNHVDSIYQSFFCKYCVDESLIGTFDNSISNAVAVYLMLTDQLPDSAIIVFSGDEEKELKGVDEVMKFIVSRNHPRCYPDMVITMDLTGEKPGRRGFTIENYSRSSRNSNEFGWSSSEDFKQFLDKMLSIQNWHRAKMIENAEADESWIYKDYDLNCFSLCLPCTPMCKKRGCDWMHCEVGVTIKLKHLIEYVEVLQYISWQLHAIYQHLDRGLAILPFGSDGGFSQI